MREMYSTPQKPSPNAANARQARTACKTPESPLSSSSSSVEDVDTVASSHVAKSLCVDPGCSDEVLFDAAASSAPVELASSPILLRFVMFGTVVVVDTSGTDVDTTSGRMDVVVVAVCVVESSGADGDDVSGPTVAVVVHVVAVTVVDTSGTDVGTTSSKVVEEVVVEVVVEVVMEVVLEVVVVSLVAATSGLPVLVVVAARARVVLDADTGTCGHRLEGGTRFGSKWLWKTFCGSAVALICCIRPTSEKNALSHLSRSPWAQGISPSM